MEKAIKIGLAILLFLCLLKMPYGYFQLVRFLALVGFAYLGWQAYESGQKNIAFIFFALALLFQPILKISLGRELWNVVDVIVGMGLVYSAFISHEQK
ncbi:MAG: hypothetical protein IPM36_17170 [Lewinellaceae bacterium]|nr:hypothetical protein [Lewinellaceae bacterium]